jgi:hypothetical protein
MEHHELRGKNNRDKHWFWRNPVEMLIYWIQVSRGAAQSIEVPVLGPRELRILKREMMRECQS